MNKNPPKGYRDRLMSGITARFDSDAIPPGKMSVITIAHDKWCRQLKGKGDCNCNPTISFPGDQ